MKRGDLVTVALQGDHGKPRPAMVMQADHFAETATVTVLLLSSTPVDAPLIRIAVEPSADNGLQRPSQIMVDKAMTVRREHIAAPIGTLDEATVLAVNRSLALFMGLA